MSDENLYKAPEADVSRTADDDEHCELGFFTADGRLGRVRYIAYTIGFTVLIYLAIIVIGAVFVAALPEEAGFLVVGLVAVVLGIGLFVLQIMWTVRRCHDFNSTGWLSALVILPLVPIIFWIIPGTAGSNDYGAKPPPNTGGVIAAASILPIVAILGILAAIAVPAYQDYTERAREASQSQ